MQSKKFERRIEDFTCEHCGASVVGNGYTDHCPECLWGKHVDENPGDRSANCGGSMEPIGVEERAGRYRIHYRCQSCGHQFVVGAAKDDKLETIIILSQKGF